MDEKEADFHIDLSKTGMIFGASVAVGIAVFGAAIGILAATIGLATDPRNYNIIHTDQGTSFVLIILSVILILVGTLDSRSKINRIKSEFFGNSSDNIQDENFAWKIHFSRSWYCQMYYEIEKINNQ